MRALDPSVVIKERQDPPGIKTNTTVDDAIVPVKTAPSPKATLQNRFQDVKKAPSQRSIRHVNDNNNGPPIVQVSSSSDSSTGVLDNDDPPDTAVGPDDDVPTVDTQEGGTYNVDPPGTPVGSDDDVSTESSDNQAEADRLKGAGNKAMARKQYAQAVKLYSMSLRMAPAGPNSHVYFSNRAAALCYLEQYEEAELDAERSLALNPEYGKAHARLGLSRYFLKDYYGAVEAYEAALLYEPKNVASRSYLAKAEAKISKRHQSSLKAGISTE